MKKAQTTIFIILGIVILIIFVAILYLASSQREDTLQEQIKSTQEIPADVEPIFNYAHECFEAVVKEGLFLLGSQGGYIYRSQGGRSQDYREDRLGEYFLEYDNKQVPYRISLPVGGSTCDVNLPNYPTKSVFLFPYEAAFPDSSTIKRHIHQDCFGKKIRFDPRISLEDLRLYTRENIIFCDFSSFANYDFEYYEPQVSLTSGTSRISMDINYGITLTNINTNDITELTDFKVVLDFSLEELFDFANDLMQLDISDPNFDISQQRDSDYSVLVEKDMFEKDDLITINSESLKLGGKPFKLVFGRMNRYPALEYIYSTNFGFPLVDSSTFSWNDIVTQDPLAVDPDEDHLTIRVIKSYGTNQEILSILNLNYNTKNLSTIQDNLYTVKPQDMELTFNITVSDGEYTDYQTRNQTHIFKLTR